MPIDPSTARQDIVSIVIELRDINQEMFAENQTDETRLAAVRSRAARDWLGELEGPVDRLTRWAKGKGFASAIARALRDVHRLVDAFRTFPPTHGDAAFDVVLEEMRGTIDRLTQIIETNRDAKAEGVRLGPSAIRVLQLLDASAEPLSRQQLVKELVENDSFAEGTIDNTLSELCDIKFAVKVGRGMYSVTVPGHGAIAGQIQTPTAYL